MCNYFENDDKTVYDIYFYLPVFIPLPYRNLLFTHPIHPISFVYVHTDIIRFDEVPFMSTVSLHVTNDVEFYSYDLLTCSSYIIFFVNFSSLSSSF